MAKRARRAEQRNVTMVNEIRVALKDHHKGCQQGIDVSDDYKFILRTCTHDKHAYTFGESEMMKSMDKSVRVHFLKEFEKKNPNETNPSSTRRDVLKMALRLNGLPTDSSRQHTQASRGQR